MLPMPPHARPSPTLTKIPASPTPHLTHTTHHTPHTTTPHHTSPHQVAFNVKPHLPPRRMTRGAPKATLVLDLDETLVHCSVEPSAAADLVFPVQFNGMEYQVHVQKRPHLEFFLQQVR